MFRLPAWWNKLWPRPSDSDEPLTIHRQFFRLLKWHRNQLNMQGELLGRPKFKVRFLFDAGELSLLDDCPFPCKFSKNKDPNEKFDFCGFAYPLLSQRIEDVEAWATGFRRATLFTFGEDVGSKWQHGQVVRELKE